MTTNQCAIYTRISDDREGEERGIQRQEDDCRRVAAANGYTVHSIYSDNDIGASDNTTKRKKRTGYEQLITDAKTGKFSCIIAYSFSRLTRRPREFEDLVALQLEHGITFKTCVSGEPDLSTADGLMTARFIASMDAAEAQRISERVRRANREKAKRGEPAKQWKRPFGFMEDAITHHPVEAQLIRDAVDEIIAGASLTSIRRKWERKGIKTSTGGTEWKWAPTWRVLFGWRTAGIREYPQQVKGTKTRKRAPLLDDNGEMVKAAWEPIITIEQRQAALDKLEQRTRRGERQGKWLLQGLLRCGICGRKMYGARMKAPRTSSYSCTGSGKTHMAISAELVEIQVERVNNRYLLDKALQGVKTEEQHIEAWSGEQRLADVNEKLATLEERFMNETGNSEMLLRLMDKLNEERRALQKERNEHEAQTVIASEVIHTLDDAIEWFHDRHEKSMEDRQLALQQEISYITVNKGTRGYSGKSKHLTKLKAIGDRIEITWREPHYEFNGMTAEESVNQPINGLEMNRRKGEEAEPTNDHEQAIFETRRQRLREQLSNDGDDVTQ